MVIGIILIATALAVFIYTAYKGNVTTLAAYVILSTSALGSALSANVLADRTCEADIQRLEEKIVELQQVIGPGYATDDGIYNPNDIFYAYADSTGVTLNLESTSFFWHGSYSEAFRIMELLSNPQELTEEGSRYYQYLVSDIMASEAMKQRK